MSYIAHVRGVCVCKAPGLGASFGGQRFFGPFSSKDEAGRACSHLAYKSWMEDGVQFMGHEVEIVELRAPPQHLF